MEPTLNDYHALIKLQKRRLDSPPSRNKLKAKDACTQTDEDTVNLLEENRKLKAELYESNKIFNGKFIITYFCVNI